MRFTLSGSAPKTAAVMCKLARVSGVWEMTAIGTFHDGHTVGNLCPAIAQSLLV